MPPDTQLAINAHYAKVQGAPERIPPMPNQVAIDSLVDENVTFSDVVGNTGQYVLTKREFRQIYDRAQ
jgi:hypothetical protein